MDPDATLSAWEEWASGAVERFAEFTKQEFYPEDSESFREVVGDLLADLEHLAARYGHDFSEVVETGHYHFSEEVNDDD